MTHEAMSPLRRRMIEDMVIRKLAPKTQQGYIRTVKDFAAFLGRSPDKASFEDVRRFQLHLAASGAHVPILKVLGFSRWTRRVPGVRHATTRVHHASRGRGGDVAARGTRAAEGDDGDRRPQ